MRKALRNGGIAGLDQGIYAASNVAVILLVASSSSQQEFGVFAAVLAGSTLALGAQRATVWQPFIVLHGARARSLAPTPAAHVAWPMIGLVAGLTIAWGVGGLGLTPATALALATPVAIGQDSYRHRLIAARRNSPVLLGDAVWLSVQGLLSTFAFIRLEGDLESLGHVTAWALAAFVSTLTLHAKRRQILAADPSPAPTNWELSRGIGLDFVFTNGIGQATAWIVAIVFGLASLAEYRLVFTVFGPVTVVQAAAQSFGMAELSSKLHKGEPIRKELLQLATLLASLSLALLALVQLVPATAWTRYLGSSWPESGNIVLAVGAYRAALGISMSAIVGLRAMRVTARAALLRAATGGLAAALLAIIGYAGGTLACGIMGMALAAVIGSWALMRDALRHEALWLRADRQL